MEDESEDEMDEDADLDLEFNDIVNDKILRPDTNYDNLPVAPAPAPVEAASIMVDERADIDLEDTETN